MDAMRLTQLLSGNFGDTQVPHFPLRDQVGDRTDHVFHRNAVIQPAWLVEIDGINPHTHE
ncbi:hypothetical protein D3C87_1788930 [compost metagenome]